MPLKLITAGGGSVILDANSTASTYTVTVPAVSGSFVTSADSNTVTATMLSANSVTQNKISSELKSATNTGVNFGMVLTGYVNCPSGSAHNYLDIANCFTSSYDDYLVVFNIFNGSTTSGTGVLSMAYETSGSSLTGVNGEFSSATFGANGANSRTRFAQLDGADSGILGAAAYNYPKLMGNPNSGLTAGQLTFRGQVNLNDVYNNTSKYGFGQGIIQTAASSGWYFEDYGFRTTSTMAGRGLRMWIGLDQTANGSVASSAYGTIQVYGLLRGY